MLHVNDFHELVNRILSVFLYIDLKEQIFINKNQKPVKFKKKKINENFLREMTK